MLNFMKLRKLYFAISLFVILPGVFGLVRFGLKPSIDFTGGTELELRLQPKSAESSVTAKEVKETIGSVVEVKEIEEKKGNVVVVRANEISTSQRLNIIQNLQKSYATVTELRYETIGPVLGRELLQKTIAAIVISATGITLYVAYRFREWRYGVCAVLAMFHDSLVLFGVFSLLGHFAGVQVDVLFVTAVLTVLSFSVHDTIVVYDRIRELRKKHSAMAYEDTLNLAVTETMSRSINNSMTIIFMLSALWLLGGETIRWFVFALLIGTITGTYSSTFTAVPLLSLWQELSIKNKNHQSK